MTPPSARKFAPITLGFDTGGTDGRVGNDTMQAVQNFQRKIGMEPADGYAGVTLLSRLRAAR